MKKKIAPLSKDEAYMLLKVLSYSGDLGWPVTEILVPKFLENWSARPLFFLKILVRVWNYRLSENTLV